VTALYDHRRFWARQIGLVAFLVLVFFYGCFELWRALRQPSGDVSNGILFGVIFVGGSLYAIRQLLQENRDLVVTLARNDADGTLTASVFSNFRAEIIVAPASAFTNWRLYRKPIGRRGFSFFVHVDCAEWPRPLRFDVKPGTDLTGLRQIAPEAMAELTAAHAPGAPAT
jgi:hypothetical protein